MADGSNASSATSPKFVGRGDGVRPDSRLLPNGQVLKANDPYPTWVDGLWGAYHKTGSAFSATMLTGACFCRLSNCCKVGVYVLKRSVWVCSTFVVGVAWLLHGYVLSDDYKPSVVRRQFEGLQVEYFNNSPHFVPSSCHQRCRIDYWVEGETGRYDQSSDFLLRSEWFARTCRCRRLYPRRGTAITTLRSSWAER